MAITLHHKDLEQKIIDLAVSYGQSKTKTTADILRRVFRNDEQIVLSWLTDSRGPGSGRGLRTSVDGDRQEVSRKSIQKSSEPSPGD